MKKIITSLGLEVTRKCNEKCEHCMRGEPQNLDLSKKYVDKLLMEKDIIIVNLIFSGGEPLLNEELILYTINKIIDKNLPVLSISMTTNGTIYSEKVLNAFDKFSKSRKKFFRYFCRIFNIKDYSSIRFSNDQFHKNYNDEIVNKYLNNSNNTNFYFTGFIDELDNGILLSGRAKENNRFRFGRYFNYNLKNINMYSIGTNILVIDDNLYISSTGNITSQGDGSYDDMDKINMGSLEDFSFDNLIDYKDEDTKGKKVKIRQIKKW